jgi:hypothetical protein
MTLKPILLLLGDPKETVRWQVTQFEKFISSFDVKVNEDLTRESFARALRENKYPALFEK